MPRLTDLELAQRKIKKLEKILFQHTDDVLLVINALDNIMKAKADNERGKRVARALNWIDQKNDLIRYIYLNVDFRRDKHEKDKRIARLVAKEKAKSLPPPAHG